MHTTEQLYVVLGTVPSHSTPAMRPHDISTVSPCSRTALSHRINQHRGRAFSVYIRENIWLDGLEPKWLEPRWLGILIGVCSGSEQLKKLASLGSKPVFRAESPSRPDSLQRAGALGLLRQLLAMEVVDAEGFDDDAVGEKRTERKRTNSQQRNQGTRWM